MINLLKVNFYQLKKHDYFWFLLFLMLLLSVYFTVSSYKYLEYLGEILFQFGEFINFFIPLFTVLFIGIEYEEETIRNKVFSNSRASIYLANLLTSIIVGLIYSLIYLVIVGLMGMVQDISLGISLGQTCILLIDTMFLGIALSSFFTFLSMSISNKVTSIIFAVALVLFFSSVGYEIIFRAGASTGFAKTFFTFLMYVIPTCQTALIDEIIAGGTNAYNYELLWLFSLAVSIFFTVLGLGIFKNKNLN